MSFDLSSWLWWRLVSLVVVVLMWLLLAFGVSARQAPAGQPELEAAARAFVAELAEGQFEKAAGRFDETVSRLMPAAKLEETWRAVQAQAGAFQEIAGVTYTQAQRYRIVDVTCRFTSASLIMRVAFDSAGRIGGLSFRPPAAPWSPAPSVKPDSFHERTVTVGSAPWELPGTLTLPKGKGPFAAVVLVHGSGPNDQDETILANKPFKDLAWGLASRGIAVLRYHKRSWQYGAKLASILNFTVVDEVVDDARLAVKLLAAQPEVDPQRIFVVGHSLGATLAPRIAQGPERIAGLLILAGATRPIEELVVEQVVYLSQRDGTITPEEQKQIDAAHEFVRRVRDPNLKPEDSVSMLGVPLSGSYVLDMRAYDPAATASKMKIPMLILQGERDYQVRMADFEGWKKALAGRDGVQFKSYPALNHLFIAGSGPSSPAEYARPGQVADEVVEDIAQWIGAQKPKQ